MRTFSHKTTLLFRHIFFFVYILPTIVFYYCTELSIYIYSTFYPRLFYISIYIYPFLSSTFFHTPPSSSRKFSPIDTHTTIFIFFFFFFENIFIFKSNWYICTNKKDGEVKRIVCYGAFFL